MLEQTLVAASSSVKETMLKEKKDKRKRSFKRSSKDRGIEILEPPELKRSSRRGKNDSKDGNYEDRSCDRNQEKHKGIGPGHKEELRGKAKMLNEEKDKRKRSLRTSSRRHVQTRDSNDRNNEMDGCDIVFMGIEQVPVEQRMEMPKSRISQRVQNTVIDGTPLSSPGRNAKDANNIQQTKMAIGAPSWSDSVSSSDESDDQSQGRVDIASGSRTRIDSSSENDSPGDENLENGETRESISESSIEEYSSEFEDTDYEGNRSDISQSDSDDQGYSSEENLEVDEHDVVEDRKRKAKDVLEDELDADKHNLVENKKRKPANVHEESGKKKKKIPSWRRYDQFKLHNGEVHPTCHPMIIAPLTMLRAWANELKRWNVNIPFHNLNDPELSGEENAIAASIIQRVGSSKKGRRQHKDYKRMVKLYSWTKDRSILGIGYDLFEKLAGEHSKGDHGKKFRKILLELPGILFLDEGHTPRNQNSQLWKALTKVKTGRRIILSGTPFQNNFDELYNTFCLVNQKFSEDISIETCRNRAVRKNNPAKGKWASLTNLINKNADDAVEELRAMMDPFVHVHKGTILQESLPGLRDTLVVLNPTDLQQKLLTRIPEDCFLERVHLLSMISVHPSLVAQNKLFSDQKNFLEQLKTRPEAGVKTQFVIEIVRLSKARGEKVLIFSEYLDPLRFLMKHLASYFSWEEGKQVLYMDGAMDEKQRQLVIHSLNNNESESQVLLASTKACSEGINLVGASRVVLLDVVWNPSVERQAISRAYRLGQKKFVYVYHLITSKTLEVEKYQRQAKKDRISERVFSSPYEQNHRSDISKIVSGDSILEAMVHHEKLKHIFEMILHQPKESGIFENFNFVC
ncbi:hypothetical protein M9H77_32998 [Catharanthus roseus]|uniref:Uncharacterized protein n=1 Tax=Catharanthus roseus TaxID=4058 RepID=A0ACC0A4W7_CATRO|nr:hypothetical protein M9H77_32998 [Catharanthus roseus]